MNLPASLCLTDAIMAAINNPIGEAGEPIIPFIYWQLVAMNMKIQVNDWLKQQWSRPSQESHLSPLFWVSWHGVKYTIPCSFAFLQFLPAYKRSGVWFIYKRGPACRSLDWGKYVFFPGYCVFVNIKRSVHIWLLGFFLELHTCPCSHSGQNLFSPAYHSNSTQVLWFF